MIRIAIPEFAISCTRCDTEMKASIKHTTSHIDCLYLTSYGRIKIEGGEDLLIILLQFREMPARNNVYTT